MEKVNIEFIIFLFFLLYLIYLFFLKGSKTNNKYINNSNNNFEKKFFVSKLGNSNTFRYKYVKKQYLLTKNELKFYYFLINNISDKYSIMCSVRVIDIIEPFDKKDFTAKAKIIQKHIDFLIVNKGYLNPILAIELNDSSHKDAKRYERDNFLDLAFQSAGMPLLFVSTRDLNKKDYLRKILSDFIDLK